MKLYNIEFTRLEVILIFLLLITLTGFFLNTAASQHTINEYINAHTECLQSLSYAERGFFPSWNDIENITIPKGVNNE
jgi:hypothetical protein